MGVMNVLYQHLPRIRDKMPLIFVMAFMLQTPQNGMTVLMIKSRKGVAKIHGMKKEIVIQPLVRLIARLGNGVPGGLVPNHAMEVRKHGQGQSLQM
tara:strand:- start:128 stop:415 length:288 start_codon:yes stop_codon:yes gene_type:complete